MWMDKMFLYLASFYMVISLNVTSVKALNIIKAFLGYV